MANGEWDVFGWEFGLGLPVSFFGADAIATLISETSGAEIDQLIIGYNGEETKALAECRRMLGALGFFMGLDYSGRIIFARLRMATIEDIANAANITITPIPRILEQTTGASEAIDKIVATFGELPYKSGQVIEVNAVGDADALVPPNSLRAGLFGEKRDIQLDMSVISLANADESAPYNLIALLALRSFGAPTIRFRATDPGTISHGDFLKIGDPGLRTSWFVDASTGDPIEVNSDARWFGQVIEFKRDHGDGSIELGMLMHNFHLNDVARLRGPSAIVASVASNVYTCDANEFKDGSGSDVGGFTIGDKVEVFDETGALVSGTKATSDVQEITGIDTAAGTLTLDAAFTTPPSAGHVIRWARVYNTVGNDETDSAKLDGYLPYTAFAGADGFITPSDLDAHIYGYNS